EPSYTIKKAAVGHNKGRKPPRCFSLPPAARVSRATTWVSRFQPYSHGRNPSSRTTVDCIASLADFAFPAIITVGDVFQLPPFAECLDWPRRQVPGSMTTEI